MQISYHSSEHCCEYVSSSSGVFREYLNEQLTMLYKSRWKAFIYFIYTGHIHFAPLKSQGREFRRMEQAKHKEDNPTLPPLCSPKSIYRVADLVSRPSQYCVVGSNERGRQVGIEELKDLAKKDLMSKVTPDTIAKEVFSRFSSM